MAQARVAVAEQLRRKVELLDGLAGLELEVLLVRHVWKVRVGLPEQVLDQLANRAHRLVHSDRA